MSTDDVNIAEDTEMSECDGDKVVTMMEVLQEQQEFEEDANAVLGASDDKNCTYPKGYIKRQALYACLTCCSEAKVDPTKRAGVCLACSLTCHENHELVELYTKRNFRCDCGNPKFNSHPCQFTPNKTDLNEENIYNQNFSGLYCTCHRPYPDPESNLEDDMIQCIICEDWLHASHLEAVVPANDQYSEMICKLCMENNEFLHDYSLFAVNAETNDVDVITVNGDTKSSVSSLCNGDLEKENFANGVDETITEPADVTVNGDVEMNNENDKSELTINKVSDQTESSDSVNEENNQIESSNVESAESKDKDTEKAGNVENKMDVDVEDPKIESLPEKDTEAHKQCESSMNEENTEKENTDKSSEEPQDLEKLTNIEPETDKQDSVNTNETLTESTETKPECSEQIIKDETGGGDHATVSSDKNMESDHKEENKTQEETTAKNVEQTDCKETEQELPKESTTEKTEDKLESVSTTENIEVPDTSQSEQTKKENDEKSDSDLNSIDKQTENKDIDDKPDSAMQTIDEKTEKENDGEKTDSGMDAISDETEKDNVEDKQIVDKVDSAMDAINDHTEKEHVDDKTDVRTEKDNVDDQNDSVMDAIDELLKSGNDEKESEIVKESKDVTSESADSKENVETKGDDVDMNTEIKATDKIEESVDVSSNQNETDISENKSVDEPKGETENTEDDTTSKPNTSEPIDKAKDDTNETDSDTQKKTDKIDSTNESEPITDENKAPNANQDTSKEHKRKFSTELTEDSSSKKAKLECVRPKGVKRIFKGATFWPSNFRQKLCTCGECISMYKDLKVLFLTDPEDTVSAYESLGKENVAGCASQYEKGLQALSSLDRIQQINALTEYNKMRDKLLDFLKSFKDRKEIVKEEDIKAFFAGMKPRREPDGVYFCR